MEVSRTVRKRGQAPAVAALVLIGAAATGWATSQGPVADGPYVGTLPCADCAGIRTSLTLYTMGDGGLPLVYRMTVTWLGTRDGDRTEERQGPWSRVGSGAEAIVRVEPFDDVMRQSFRRVDGERLLLLDRAERPIETRQNLLLTRDSGSPGPRLAPPRTLFRGTLSRDADRLRLAPCGGGDPLVVRDVSPESMITAALTDVGFDRLPGLYLEAYGTRRGGELLIDRLNRAGTEMGCPQDAMAFSAQGNEPGWSLVSDRRGVKLNRQDGAVLSAPPLPLSWRWPGGRQDRAEARLASSTEGSALTAVLSPKLCRDTMADAVYGFTATVQVSRPSSATLRGCAYLGSESLP
jgi:uncharacterized membrane protein/uncharacterized lipoprotein NlpE involved in copper resistance